MTNDNYQNNQPVRNDTSTGAEEEIQELESRLKTLKQQTREDKGNPYMVPISIVIGGILIAGAVIYSRNASPNASLNVQPAAVTGNIAPQQAPPPSFGGGSADNVRPVSSDDHIRGNPDALVKIVEFSDLECPFCKRIHPTLKQVLSEYGDKVAWVYRHFPLDALHSKARKEAEATECANELGGNDAFWAYLDKIFEITPANNGLDLGQLPQIAQDIGLDRDKFQSCLDSGKYAQHISDDLQDATNSGGSGTPYSVIIAPDGSTTPLSGAQPFSAIKALIDIALSK